MWEDPEVQDLVQEKIQHWIKDHVQSDMDSMGHIMAVHTLIDHDVD